MATGAGWRNDGGASACTPASATAGFWGSTEAAAGGPETDSGGRYDPGACTPASAVCFFGASAGLSGEDCCFTDAGACTPASAVCGVCGVCGGAGAARSFASGAGVFCCCGGFSLHRVFDASLSHSDAGSSAVETPDGVAGGLGGSGVPPAPDGPPEGVRWPESVGASRAELRGGDPKRLTDSCGVDTEEGRTHTHTKPVTASFWSNDLNLSKFDRHHSVMQSGGDRSTGAIVSRVCVFELAPAATTGAKAAGGPGQPLRRRRW